MPNIGMQYGNSHQPYKYDVPFNTFLALSNQKNGSSMGWNQYLLFHIYSQHTHTLTHTHIHCYLMQIYVNQTKSYRMTQFRWYCTGESMDIEYIVREQCFLNNTIQSIKNWMFVFSIQTKITFAVIIHVYNELLVCVDVYEQFYSHSIMIRHVKREIVKILTF